MKKAFLSLLCSAVLLGYSLIPGTVQADTSGMAIPFPDISGHWAQNDIAAAFAAGYVSGYSDGTFRPDAPATQAEAVALIVKVLVAAHAMTFVPNGSMQLSTSGTTADQQHWVVTQGYLPTALATHLVRLDELNSSLILSLDAHATRQEVAVWLARAEEPAIDMYLLIHNVRSSASWSDDARHAAEVPGTNGPWPFRDSVTVDRMPYILAAHRAGVVQGFPDGRFGGSEAVTRAELVTMLQRVASVATMINTSGSGNSNHWPPSVPQHGLVTEVRAVGGASEGIRPLRGDRADDWPAIRRFLETLTDGVPDIPPVPLDTIDRAANIGLWLEIAYADGTVDRVIPMVRCTSTDSGGRACNPEPGWVYAHGKQLHSRPLWEEVFGQLFYFDMPQLPHN